ncbi:PA-phosphatase [Brevundimonas sp.]|uniref:PA-phosphatase n=1 Tax=Brevundimonas sp. TaxID=1871086 RepID=UPI003F723F4E
MVERQLIRAAAAAILILVPGACVTGGGGAPALPASGYLEAAALGELADGFTPSPQTLTWTEGSPAAGPGTDRWWLAIAQAELRAPDAAQHFDCVLGTRLTEEPRPALTRLMNRLLVDADSLTRRLATEHTRARPIAVDPTLQPCQRVTGAMRDSPSWPANGAVAGAAYGALFSALAPDQAAGSRARGRDIGQSRVICRMNWPGDVADGARIGEALYARVSAAPGFAADLEAARAEVTTARAEGLTHPSCASERRALAD